MVFWFVMVILCGDYLFELLLLREFDLMEMYGVSCMVMCEVLCMLMLKGLVELWLKVGMCVWLCCVWNLFDVDLFDWYVCVVLLFVFVLKL